MDVLLIDENQVVELLPMALCMEAVSKALAALDRGEATQPLREVAWLPEKRGALISMPALLPNEGSLAIKAITVFPGNDDTGFESHQGVILLFEAEHGLLEAVIDASSVTGIRTAAASGVATDLLALPDASNLALLGAGVQARSHLDAMLEVRKLRRVRVWSRRGESGRRFAAWARAERGVEVEVVGEAVDAVRGADLVCTVTAASAPVLEGDWLSPGAHVNAVGACTPWARELDAKAVARSRLFVDRRESALAEAGDILLAIEEGAVGEEIIAGELGELINGRVDGRRSAEEVTVFESLGLAVEDVAAARAVVGKARENGARSFYFGGRRGASG